MDHKSKDAIAVQKSFSLPDELKKPHGVEGFCLLRRFIMTTTSATMLPGSNALCDSNIRVRRDWNRIGEYERELYLDAIETAIEGGLHQRFVSYHADEVSDIQAHDTCAFFLWHRRYLLSYENMLRSLGARFACLTIPYWNIMEDYEKQQATAYDCGSYATCTSIVDQMGGVVNTDDFYDRTYFGYKRDGHLHFKTPIQHLRDDQGQLGIIRFDMWFDPIPDSSNALELLQTFLSQDLLFFWQSIQHGIHDDVHDTIGGLMRTPSSPIDPLFFPWHSTIDMFGYLWEICHGLGVEDEEDIGTKLDAISDLLNETNSNKCLYTDDAKAMFPDFHFFRDKIYMKRDGLDIRDDPLIGMFFQDDFGMDFAKVAIAPQSTIHEFGYTYDSRELVLRLALENTTSSRICPNAAQFWALDDMYSIALNNNMMANMLVATFSVEELQFYLQNWTKQAVEYIVEIYSNDTTKQEQQIRYIDCILDNMDHDTLERWAIDDVFLELVVIQNRFFHPECQKESFGISDSEISTVTPERESSVSASMLMCTTLHWPLGICYLVVRFILRGHH